MGCPELPKTWLNISGMEMSRGQAFHELQCPAAALPSLLSPFNLADTNSKTQLDVVPAWERTGCPVKL